MRSRLLVIIALAAMSCVAAAQTIGPGGIEMAPGPSQPRGYTPGGTGPGGVQVAPGPAARGAPIERVSPGGTLVAPGPAGSVSTAPSFRAPAVVRTPRHAAIAKKTPPPKAKKKKKRKPSAALSRTRRLTR